MAKNNDTNGDQNGTGKSKGADNEFEASAKAETPEITEQSKTGDGPAGGTPASETTETDDSVKDSAGETTENFEPSETPESPESPVANPNEPMPPDQAVVMKRGGFGRIADWMRGHKKTSVVLGLLLILIVLGALPWTRYPILGTFYKQNMNFALTDTDTHKPVSNATLVIAGKKTQTDGQGRASIKVPVGSKTVTITKKYYQTLTQKVFVPIRKPATTTLAVKATGRQVPVTVTNKISGKPLENAVVKVLDADAKTDKDGHATLVVPTEKATRPATITASGFNTLTAEIQVITETVAANTFAMTPSGSVYFLSNLSGKLDVVKTNLDGSSRKTVLAGTGKEDKQSTLLLASRDWKYLALLANRDGAEKLYLIDTASDVLTTMDEGANVDFTAKGWSNDTFIYTVDRQNAPTWQSGQQVLKGYNAASKKLNQLDQTAGSGNSAFDAVHEFYGDVYIFPKGQIIFVKGMNAGQGHPGGLTGQQVALQSVNDDGAGKKTIKAFPVPDSSYTTYANALTAPDGPSSLYVQDPYTSTTFYEYEDGQFKADSSMTGQKFFSPYSNYLLSPNGNQTFWSETRDGKSLLFTGDSDGNNPKQVASLSDYSAFGWYGENYVFATKNNSELYILPVDGSTGPLKVSDYYRSGGFIKGYGGGYGGF